MIKKPLSKQLFMNNGDCELFRSLTFFSIYIKEAPWLLFKCDVNVNLKNAKAKHTIPFNFNFFEMR